MLGVAVRAGIATTTTALACRRVRRQSLEVATAAAVMCYFNSDVQLAVEALRAELVIDVPPLNNGAY